ncbi:hypothetical protein VTN00DRAFT_4153 [Thermoascus crustaceus]|uniref:uncharacterized protein n=1 Tax=Thermoascus crustaceus TaxID=5088 RepID=UPI0037441A59
MPPTSLAAEELQALRNKAKAQIERLWTAVWQHPPPGLCLSSDDLEKIGIKWLPFTWTSSGDNSHNTNTTNTATDNINSLTPTLSPASWKSCDLILLIWIDRARTPRII